MDPEASISFVGEVCSRAAMVGEDVGVAVVGVAWRRGWWRFPSLAAPLTIGLGFVGGVCGSRRTSCFEPPAPTSIYSTVRRGPTNHVGLGAPDQGARTRPKKAVGPNWWEIKPNTYLYCKAF